jgi:hypothetical protein
MLGAALLVGACGSSRPDPPAAWTGTPATSADVPPAFAVPEGARLLVPAIYTPSDLSGSALLSIRRRPRLTWARLLRRLDRRYPRRYVDESGCATDPEKVLSCSVSLVATLSDGRHLGIAASLRRVPDDVSGGYLLALRSVRVRRLSTRSGPSRGLRPRLPPRFPTPSARTPPRVGELLSPSREPQRYTLLAGSQLVAIYGTGSLTGGFNAVLRVLPGHDPIKIGRAYARQARQEAGPISVDRRPGNVTVLFPPGGAGGYQGVINVLDPPGNDRDLIVYDLYND